jgi:hypothetical protein
MKIFNTAIALFVLGTVASARYLRSFEESFDSTLQTPNFIEANFTQLVDHFAEPPDPRTFNQRYFYNDTFWDKTIGPVFLFICGEGRCNPPTKRGYPMQVCQDLKCLFYVVEHRFYGDSQPFPDWSTTNLKYLNSTQALADLANFLKTTDAALVQKYGG